MNFRKLMAGTLAATMVAGSSMTVFAEDANSATGTGTAFDHVDKKVTSVTFPTTTAVADVFNYYVDPERAINSAGTLTDGTAVTGNTDGVYFTHPGTPAGEDTPASVTAFSINSKDESDTSITVTIPENTSVTTLTYDGSDWKDDEGNVISGVTVTGETPVANDTITVSPFVAGTPAGAASFSSSSEAVEFKGMNSVDVDVSVAASVEASAGGKDIALVAKEEDLTAATEPALLMSLKVGAKTSAITSDGTEVKEKIVGKPNNFAITTSNGKFVYGVRTDTDTDNGGTALDPWGATTVQLVGKTNQKDIPSGMTAPSIKLTWTVAEHTDSYLSTTSITSSSNSVAVTLPSGVSVSKIELLKANSTTPVTMTAGNHYTKTGDTYTFTASMVTNWKNGSLKFTFSDNKTETVSVQ